MIAGLLVFCMYFRFTKQNKCLIMVCTNVKIHGIIKFDLLTVIHMIATYNYGGDLSI